MPQHKRKTNKPPVRNQRRGATQGDGPAYRGQVSWKLHLPFPSVLLTTTVTTGVVANATIINTGQVFGFAARFGSTFDEYRILGCVAKIRPISNTSGVSSFWWDEKSTATPTLLESQERTQLRLVNNSANSASFREMRWTARDLLDLQYTPIGTSNSNPVTFKTYTDLADYGAPAAVTPLWFVEFDLLIEFRGLKST